MSKEKKKKTKRQIEKEIELQADDLFTKVISENLTTLTEKVGWILNHYPTARDSDITCQIKYWEKFEPDAIKDGSIRLIDLYKYTRLTSIVRSRAKIQNDYKMFLASEEVRKHRGMLEEDIENWAVSNSSDYPMFSVFIDESGKTGNYIILGSFWVVDDMSSVALLREIMDLKLRLSYDQEIHFTNISNAKEKVYKQLIDLLYEHSSTFCFKYSIIEKEGNRNINEVLNILLYHLLLDGVKHEHETGRAPLPRSLQVIKDLESKGSDKIMLKEVKDRLNIASSSLFDKKLYLGEFKPVDSKENIHLQIVDVFTGSINRLINEKPDAPNAKDRVANYFMQKFEIEIDLSKVDKYKDIIARVEI